MKMVRDHIVEHGFGRAKIISPADLLALPCG